MKRLVFVLACLLTATLSFSQGDSTKAPYLRFKGFPPVKLLNTDSTTFFTKDDLPKKKAVLLMIFNPMCEHCQHETEEIVKHIDEFKDIQIVMTTMLPFDSMMSFRARYKLAQYKNIIMAQDTHYFLPSYYMISNLPFLAFYDKKKELISVFEGSLPIEKVLETFRNGAE